MTWNIIYEPDQYQRIIFAVMVDARKGTSLANQIGTVIKSYVDTEIAKVNENVLFYRVETLDGNLGGYFGIDTTSPTVVLSLYLLRPAFQQFNTEISGQITNFINGNLWEADKL